MANSFFFFQGEEILSSSTILLKELEARNKTFDIIFVTDSENIDIAKLRKFLNRSGSIISTIPVHYYSDNCNCIFGCIIFVYLRLQYYLQVGT